MKNRKSLKWKILIPFVMIVLFTTGLALWQPQPSMPLGVTYRVFGKIQDSLEAEKEIVLSKEEVNILLREYVKESKEIGDFQIRGIEIDIKDKDVILYLPISYRGISFLLSTRGQMIYEEPFIAYKPKGLRIGKLPIPKGVMLYFLEKQENQVVVIEEDTIKIDKAVLSLPISSFVIREEQMAVRFDQENNQQWAHSFPQQEARERTKVQEVMNDVVDSLDKVKGNLSEDGQKNMINEIQNAIKNIVENPESQSQANIGEAKALYNTLTSHQKNEVMGALLSEVDREALLILKEEFGF